MNTFQRILLVISLAKIHSNDVCTLILIRLSHVDIIDILITREIYRRISLISWPGAQLRIRICSDYAVREKRPM